MTTQDTPPKYTFDDLIWWADHPMATSYAQRILTEMAYRLRWASQKRGRRGLTRKQRAFAAKLIAEIDERQRKLDQDPRPKDSEGNIIIDAHLSGWDPAAQHPVLGAAMQTWHEEHAVGLRQRDTDTLRSVEEAVRGYLQGDVLTQYIDDLARSWGVECIDSLMGVSFEKALAKGKLTSRKQVQALLHAIPGWWEVAKLGEWRDNDWGRSRRVSLRCGDELMDWWSGRQDLNEGDRLIITRVKVKYFGAGQRRTWKGYNYPQATKVSIRQDGYLIVSRNNNNNEE